MLGCVLTSDKHIFTFSSYNLSDCEKLVLSSGLNFCAPTSSRNIDSVTIFSDFDLLIFQLLNLSPVSQLNMSYLKTRLVDLPNELINTTVNSNGFLWQKNHFEVAKFLKRNSDILITRPDKDAGVVILNRTD